MSKNENKKSKIAILTASNFPYGGAGASFLRQLAKGLINNNSKVEIIRFWGERNFIPNDTGIPHSNYLFKRPFKREFFKFLELFIQIIYIPFFIAYRKLFKNDKVLILYCVERAYFVVPIMLWCKIFRISCFRIVAEIWPKNLIAPYWWRRPNIFFYNLQLRKFDKYLNGVIVLSKYIYDVCIKNGLSSKQLLLVPHFIDLHINKKVEDKVNNTFRIGFAGNPSFENGIIDLLIAFNNINKMSASNFELVIMGEITKKVKDQIDESDLISANLILTGLLSKDEVEHQLVNCDVLINPRCMGLLADSGFPTKLGEYFATKNPVISTRVGDLNEYFTDKKELIFATPNNPQSISDAILYVYNNIEESKIIGINGFKWAADNLDFNKNGKKVISFIEEIIN